MDVIGDSKATRKRFAILEQLTQIPLMGVAQGRDYEEYVATFKFFAARCKWVGLPMQPALERRQERIRLLQTNEITCNIHLLGMSRDDLMYEQSVRYLACIKGIDSTKPIAAALNGIWLPNAQPQATKRKADYFATPNEVCRHYVSLMWYNVKYLKGLVCACTD